MRPGFGFGFGFVGGPPGQEFDGWSVSVLPASMRWLAPKDLPMRYVRIRNRYSRMTEVKFDLISLDIYLSLMLRTGSCCYRI